MNILSLDMSTKSSGWALFEDKKLKNYGLQPKNDINYGYKWKFFNELCKNGVVNKYHYTRLKKS